MVILILHLCTIRRARLQVVPGDELAQKRAFEVVLGDVQEASLGPIDEQLGVDCKRAHVGRKAPIRIILAEPAGQLCSFVSKAKLSISKMNIKYQQSNGQMQKPVN